MPDKKHVELERPEAHLTDAGLLEYHEARLAATPKSDPGYSEAERAWRRAKKAAMFTEDAIAEAQAVAAEEEKARVEYEAWFEGLSPKEQDEEVVRKFRADREEGKK